MRSVLIGILAAFGILSTAEARSTEQFCERLSHYAGPIVDYRDNHRPYSDAVAYLVEDFQRYAHAVGGISDTMINTMVAVDIVQKVYQVNHPTAAQAAADIYARCLHGAASPAISSEQEQPQSLSPPPSSVTFQQGLTDRQNWEGWFAGLTGDHRLGAEYWAGQRSLPKPVSCEKVVHSSEWRAGCIESRNRLAPFDVRRKSEPQYRLGWNSFSSNPAGDSPPSAAISSVPVANETWYVVSPRDGLCFLTRDAFAGARTPEEVVTKFEKRGITYIIHRSENGMISLHNVNDRDNILALFKDKEFCEFAAKMAKKDS